MLCEQCTPRELKAMRALESLTPNGSEFVNDPETCVAFVRARLAFTIELAKERNQLREEVYRLRNEIQRLRNELAPHMEGSWGA